MKTPGGPLAEVVGPWGPLGNPSRTEDPPAAAAATAGAAGRSSPAAAASFHALRHWSLAPGAPPAARGPPAARSPPRVARSPPAAGGEGKRGVAKVVGADTAAASAETTAARDVLLSCCCWRGIPRDRPPDAQGWEGRRKETAGDRGANSGCCRFTGPPAVVVVEAAAVAVAVAGFGLTADAAGCCFAAAAAAAAGAADFVVSFETHM